MSADWYLHLDDRQYGPLSAAELKRYASEGRMTPETLVRKGEEGTWVPASRVKGLHFAGPPSLPARLPQQLPAQAPQAVPAKPARRHATQQPTAIKQCGFCAATIPETALKCQYCGETLDPALRAAEEAKRAVELAQSSAGGASPLSVSTVVTPTTVIQQKKGFPHLLHLILTILTCGIWLPIWIIHCVIWALL